MNTITNIDQIIATRDLCEEIIVNNGLDLDIYEAVYPNGNLPSEFIVVKSITQSDDGRPINEGTVEICVYVHNLDKDNDQSQPNMSRLKTLSDVFVAGIKNASKNKIAFNDFRTMLVKDTDIRYFYQSIVVETVSINI